VKLVVSNGTRDRTTIFDNLLSWNLPEFEAAIGRKVVFGEEVEVDPNDYLYETGRLHLNVENYEGTDRNKVGKYLPGPMKAKVNEDGEPSEIPF
jgi:hypothetical protein